MQVERKVRRNILEIPESYTCMPFLMGTFLTGFFLNIQVIVLT